MRLVDRADPAARQAETSTAAPLRAGSRLHTGLLALLVGINLLVLLNALLHDPAIGYDAKHHLRYIEALAQLRLPTAADTREFFAPPLPYLLPALFMAAAKVDVAAAAKFAQLVQVLLSIGITCYLLKLCELIWPGAVRVKLGALLCLGMLPVYYKTLAFVRGEPYVALFTLLAVYQLLRLCLGQETGGGRRETGDRRREAGDWRLATGDWRSAHSSAITGLQLWRGVALGVTMGLLALARQWGLLVLPALALFGLVALLRSAARLRLLAALALSGAVAVLLGGWFYLGLQREYGSITAFNRDGQPFAFANQPAQFYTGLGEGQLFNEPIRPAFPNQLLPILYSETWGDYWAYFLVYARETRLDLYIQGDGFEDIAQVEAAPWLETNRQEMAAYLGRVNLVALLPTALLLSGCLLGGWQLARWLTAHRLTASIRAGVRRQASGVRSVSADAHAICARRHDEHGRSGSRFSVLGSIFTSERSHRCSALALLALVVLASALGYGWFLVSYPNLDQGDTIKASFMLHLFPLVAVLAAAALEELHHRAPALYRAAIVALALAWVHNLPAMVSRY